MASSTPVCIPGTKSASLQQNGNKQMLVYHNDAGRMVIVYDQERIQHILNNGI